MSVHLVNIYDVNNINVPTVRVWLDEFNVVGKTHADHSTVKQKNCKFHHCVTNTIKPYISAHINE